jgi:hypothetical protein
MSSRLPEGWSMRQCRDSLFSFNKLVHWSEMIDPPPDSYGYDDTMSLYVRFHQVQNDSAQAVHIQLLDRVQKQITELKEHRSDSIYRGKKGFYNWWGKWVQLQTRKLMLEYVYFKNCSITYHYYKLYDGLKYYDEKVDAEAEEIKKTLMGYLGDQ